MPSLPSFFLFSLFSPFFSSFSLFSLSPPLHQFVFPQPKLGRQTETLLCHPLAKDHCWCRHEVWEVQKAFHDTRHQLRGDPSYRRIFVKDYWENKPHIMRELLTILSSHSLAVDHQRKVVKRTLGGDVVGHGGQTFTICGDFGLLCGVYVVPDTALSWARQAMSEVIDRHQAAGVEVPKSLYMDCGCCSGRATSHQSTSSDTTTSGGPSSQPSQPCGGPSSQSDWMLCI